MTQAQPSSRPKTADLILEYIRDTPPRGFKQLAFDMLSRHGIREPAARAAVNTLVAQGKIERVPASWRIKGGG